MRRRTDQTVVGDIQEDGSMLFRVDVPPGVDAVEINNCVWPVPAGATQMHIEIRTNDCGDMRTSARAVYRGESTWS